jgi:hypothetical protein
MKRALTTLQLVFLGAAALFAAGVVSFGAGPATAVSGNAGPITVSVNPTSGVSDGQAVAIHAEAPSGTLIYSLKAHLCRPGANIRTHFDWSFSGVRCPGVSVGAGDVEQVSEYGNGTTSAELDSFKVGEGQVAWASATGHSASIDCGPGNPCDVVVQIEITNDTVFYSAPLCYGTGCPPEGQASDTPTPVTSPPPAAPAAAAGSATGGGSSTGTATPPATSAPAAAGASNAGSRSKSASEKVDSQALADSQPASATVVAEDQPSRPMRVFVAALAGALGAWRIVTVVNRTRRRRTGGVGIA